MKQLRGQRHHATHCFCSSFKQQVGLNTKRPSMFVQQAGQFVLYVLHWPTHWAKLLPLRPLMYTLLSCATPKTLEPRTQSCAWRLITCRVHGRGHHACTCPA